MKYKKVSYRPLDCKGVGIRKLRSKTQILSNAFGCSLSAQNLHSIGFKEGIYYLPLKTGIVHGTSIMYQCARRSHRVTHKGKDSKDDRKL